MKKVNVYPNEYTWVCPECGQRNYEYEIVEKIVQCAVCLKNFEVKNGTSNK